MCLSVLLLLFSGIENIEQKARKIQRGNRQLSVFAWEKCPRKLARMEKSGRGTICSQACSTRFDLTLFEGGVASY